MEVTVGVICGSVPYLPALFRWLAPGLSYITESLRRLLFSRGSKASEKNYELPRHVHVRGGFNANPKTPRRWRRQVENRVLASIRGFVCRLLVLSYLPEKHFKYKHKLNQTRERKHIKKPNLTQSLPSPLPQHSSDSTILPPPATYTKTPNTTTNIPPSSSSSDQTSQPPPPRARERDTETKTETPAKRRNPTNRSSISQTQTKTKKEKGYWDLLSVFRSGNGKSSATAVSRSGRSGDYC